MKLRVIILPILIEAKCVHARKEERESLQRDRPGGLTSPAFHAYGSASFFAHGLVTAAFNGTSATSIQSLMLLQPVQNKPTLACAFTHAATHTAGCLNFGPRAQ